MLVQPAMFQAAMFTFPDSEDEDEDSQYTILLELVAGESAQQPVPADEQLLHCERLLHRWPPLAEILSELSDSHANGA